MHLALSFGEPSDGRIAVEPRSRGLWARLIEHPDRPEHLCTELRVIEALGDPIERVGRSGCSVAARAGELLEGETLRAALAQRLGEVPDRRRHRWGGRTPVVRVVGLLAVAGHNVQAVLLATP